MKTLDILTAIVENYEVGNGMGIFSTEYCDNIRDYIRFFFRGEIVDGCIQSGFKYLYSYGEIESGRMLLAWDTKIVSKSGDEIYLYRIS